jgi:hypothetical protein
MESNQSAGKKDTLLPVEDGFGSSYSIIKISSKEILK